MLAQGILAALLGMTLGCGGSSPAGPTPTITPTPVTPAPVAPGVYTVTASTNTVAPGGQLSVNWTTSIAYPWDWISLDRVGAAVGIHAWAQSTAGAASGTFTLSAPTQAGQYEFRYLLEDESDAGRSSPVTVGAGR
jgi:Ca-activated chloride channel family protein